MTNKKKAALPLFRSLHTIHIFLLFAVLLALRVLFTEVPAGGQSLFLPRLGIPAVIAFLALAFGLNQILHKTEPMVRFLSSKHPALAGTLAVFSLTACYLDISAGLEPVLVLPALLLLGLVYWNQPKFLAFSVGAISLALAVILWFGTGGVTPDDAFIIILSVFLTAISAEVIRRNVLPSEERMESLEEENRELWNLSYRDTLTGLYNRRYMQQTAEHLFNRAVRYRELLWILMIDIDHFKKVNDKLGHATGDEVLQKTATTIQTFIRSTDTVARYGGEEFIVFIVQSNAEMAQFVANRIRDGVANMRLEEVPWPITISIGVAGRLEGDTLDSQIARADQFLYLAKKGGRNRVSGL